MVDGCRKPRLRALSLQIQLSPLKLGCHLLCENKVYEQINMKLITGTFLDISFLYERVFVRLSVGDANMAYNHDHLVKSPIERCNERTSLYRYIFIEN